MPTKTLQRCKETVAYARKKRQKLYARVKKKPFTRLNPAETVQQCKEKVGYAPKNGRNFTIALLANRYTR
ncbi:hypothetical protein HXT42_04200 [Gardnerella sp. DNF01192]